VAARLTEPGSTGGERPSVPPGNSRASKHAVPVIAVLLAACAGATDVLAFFGLGKAFAGIVTGSLVTAGYAVATGNAALVKPPVTAVTCFAVGEIVWARLLRRPQPADRLLVAELVLFLLVLTGWLVAGSHPAGALALVLLALLSVALGGQSIWALRIHQTTTYFTGMLTTTINAAASGATAGTGTSIRQLGALLGGAIVSGATMHTLRPATPAVPLLLLAAAATVHIRNEHQSCRSRS
jgi:uncharacterized membrane protein YoaK (UPF0700 family)